jgi:hypothetical protein
MFDFGATGGVYCTAAGIFSAKAMDMDMDRFGWLSLLSGKACIQSKFLNDTCTVILTSGLNQILCTLKRRQIKYCTKII